MLPFTAVGYVGFEKEAIVQNGEPNENHKSRCRHNYS